MNLIKFLKRVFTILKESEKPKIDKVLKFFGVILYLTFLFGFLAFLFYFFLAFIS
jgi:hypothetical protein